MNSSSRIHQVLCLAALVLAILLIAARPVAAAEVVIPGDPDQPYGPGFTIRVVDERGRPVEGALAGLNVATDSEGTTVGCNEVGRLTDSNGEVRLEKGSLLLDRIGVVAIHASRSLVGIRIPDESDEDQTVTPFEVVVVPGCRVEGRAVISQLAHQKQPLGLFIGVAAIGDFTAFQWRSRTGEFELLLPPGDYEFYAHGTYGQEVKREMHVEAGVENLHLDPIDLPAFPLGYLLGQPAPELRGINDWKNSDGVKLADLRGRYVLLHFWGHWCGPCISRMPDLFEVRDRFPEDKLAIVGVHVGIEGEEEVDTSEELDVALAEIRSQRWNGRDLPFPVALVKAEKTRHFGVDKNARSQAAANYGIVHYPTTILIDPSGKILGDIDSVIHGSDWSKLDRLLGKEPE